jgi:hypothetical protein
MTGCSFDGLKRDGVNRNQGAESALALIGTLYAYDLTASTAGRTEHT